MHNSHLLCVPQVGTATPGTRHPVGDAEASFPPCFHPLGERKENAEKELRCQISSAALTAPLLGNAVVTNESLLQLEGERSALAKSE